MRAAAWGAALRARPPGAPMRRSAARERGHGRENGAGAPGRSAWSWTGGGRRARWRPARWTRAPPTPRTAPFCGSCCACWPRRAPGRITPGSLSTRAARGPTLLLQCSLPRRSRRAVQAGHARPNFLKTHVPARRRTTRRSARVTRPCRARSTATTWASCSSRWTPAAWTAAWWPRPPRAQSCRRRRARCWCSSAGARARLPPHPPPP